jgi:hypothetical protein
MAKQYISVSGVEAPRHIEAIERFGVRHCPPSPALLIGVQASEKTQYHKIENSRGPNWHPVGDTIWRLFQSAPTRRVAGRIIHYSFADTNQPRDIERLTCELLDRTPDDAQVDGFQFNNLAWNMHNFAPLVEKTRARVFGDYIIAQLSKSILELADPIELAQRLADSGVSHALLDSSGGVGRPFDESQYILFIESLREHAPHVGIGVAGGLGPDDAIAPYQKLLASYPFLSCDAEGALRTYDVSPMKLSDSKFSTKLSTNYILAAEDAVIDANRSFDSWWRNSKMHSLDPKTEQILRDFHRSHWDKVSSAPGSSHNHQAWSGGYLEHIRQVNEFAVRLYEVWSQMGVLEDLKITGEDFSLSDAVLVTTVHDLEKIFRLNYDSDGNLALNTELSSKAQREAFKFDLLKKYKIELTTSQLHALQFAEGMTDTDYSPNNRVMSPLAAFVHVCDLMSARGSYNLGSPT